MASIASLGLAGTALAQSKLEKQVNESAKEIEGQVIEWRRDFHEHPELGNEEIKTAGKVAAHLRSLGMEVTEGIAVTGVVGILKGGKPGPTVALRADMDALPVTERTDVPFKSQVMTTYNGQESGVMHACGHDSHMAILMGVAEVLSGMQKELKGTVKFIFQPSEEGLEDKNIDTWGAKQMVEEGVMTDVDVIFGLHINSQTPAGVIKYKPGPAMAAVDELEITVKGKQAHGAYPWSSIDPIVTASQIVMGLQTVVSRNVKIIEIPAIVTIGAIHGGVRHNIIPEKVEMIGTIRTYSQPQQELIHRRIREIGENIAKSAGAEADVRIKKMYPVTFNDVELTAKMQPTLERVAGKDNLWVHDPVTGAEDFSFFQLEKPGLFFFLGAMPVDGDPEEAPSHHTPDFYLDESGFVLGVRALSQLTIDYMEMSKK
ncbi:N-acyl-L-amino acid amidohydrolase [Cyclobacterium qasimii M12-11B]|uniref:N-acyl-L-amino acid amidohydrolase n=1 Tax=Cyclobacterium qasimii M12-11B TaxID=641524 RepID=S7WIN7_9BACT|nr:N-acyl-L-amino acid amidohydrolase [Cyclobacterium qasimii M12-11B]